jgi:hypothetical protein
MSSSEHVTVQVNATVRSQICSGLPLRTLDAVTMIDDDGIVDIAGLANGWV